MTALLLTVKCGYLDEVDLLLSKGSKIEHANHVSSVMQLFCHVMLRHAVICWSCPEILTAPNHSASLSWQFSFSFHLLILHSTSPLSYTSPPLHLHLPFPLPFPLPFSFPLPSLQHGDSPLIEAAKCGHLEVVRLLLDRGANIDHKNRVRKHSQLLGCISLYMKRLYWIVSYHIS